MAANISVLVSTEVQDVHVAVEWLLKEEKASRVALWDHSMGAATALMIAGSKDRDKDGSQQRDRSIIAGMVLNSLKSALRRLPRLWFTRFRCPPTSQESSPYLWAWSGQKSREGEGGFWYLCDQSLGCC